MIIESVFSVVISVFAVFGVYCAAKMFFGCFYSEIPAAVIVEASDDLEILKMKIREADSVCLCGKCGMIIFVPKSLECDENIIQYVKIRGYNYFYYDVER